MRRLRLMQNSLDAVFLFPLRRKKRCALNEKEHAVRLGTWGSRLAVTANISLEYPITTLTLPPPQNNLIRPFGSGYCGYQSCLSPLTTSSDMSMEIAVVVAE